MFNLADQIVLEIENLEITTGRIQQLNPGGKTEDTKQRRAMSDTRRVSEQ